MFLLYQDDLPELEDVPPKWNGKTNWLPKLDREDGEDSDWKYWSWDCEFEEEDKNMGESCEGEEEGEPYGRRRRS
jgi:hypothetical protein